MACVRATDRRGLPGAVLGVVGVGLLVRLPFVATADFPLNDGGLFVAMARDILSAGYALPATTSYNGGGIPFAYPPLALYLAAALSELLSADLAALLLVLPAAASLLVLAAFLALSRRLLDDPHRSLLAALVFALLPGSYSWLMMGGGLTRSVGLLFALLALRQVPPLLAEGRPAAILAMGAALSLAMLSHLEAALFAICGSLAFWAASGRRRRGLLGIGAAFAAALLIAAPWWATVLTRHGTAPFLAAARTGGWSAVELALVPPRAFEEMSPLVFLAGMLGVAGCAFERRWLLPLWLLATMAANPRSVPTYVTVPWAMLASAGVLGVAVPGLARIGSAPALRRWIERCAVAGVLGSLALADWRLHASGDHALVALTAAEREAMRALAATPPESRVLVISTAAEWPSDPVAEWFPVLAERRSVLTLQGTEWLPDREFSHRRRGYETLKAQGVRSLGDLRAWSEGRWAEPGRRRAREVEFSHLYLARGGPGAVDLGRLRAEILRSPDYRVLADSPQATVFARIRP